METNPYARGSGPAAPASGDPALTPEQQKLNDYTVAVGKNADYFVPRFEDMDNGGSRFGWNWPAFFITGPYFLYRKMWLAGFLYIFWPFILMLPLGILAALMPNSAALLGGLAILLYLASWFVMPICANAFYWSKINALIRNLPRNVATQPDKRQRRLANNGGTTIAVPLVVFLFGGFGWLGIVAAISIPAYQDYMIRAQVSEGIYYAGDAKSAVVHFYGSRKTWPADNAEAGFGGTNNKFIESIEIDRGSVIVTYGGEANEKLRGGRLAFVPGLNATGGVVWVCGDGPTPDGVTLSDGPRGIEMEEKYLPANCRGAPRAAD